MTTTLPETRPEVAPDPVIDVLKAGLRRVKAGWNQHEYREGSNYCVLGAIGYTYAEGPIEHSIWRAGELLEALIDPDHTHLDEWNDDPDRTQTDVIRLFERAIAEGDS